MIWSFNDFGENIAVIKENGETVYYSQLKRESDALASHVKERGLVFVLCANELGSLMGYVGFLNNNIVPLMLDAELDKSLLDSLTDIYKPDCLWAPERMAADFSGYKSIYAANGYVLLETGFHVGCEPGDELALLLTTSGSTGSPKLVRQSYDNIRANTRSIVEYLEISENDRAVTTLPMNYTYGLSVINSHLYAGASIILTEKTLMQKEFWQQAREYKATNFGGVPYTYEILRRLRFLNMELPHLKYVTQAGGKLDPALCLEYAKGMRQKDKDFIVMYGATEATARMSYIPRNMAVEKAGSIGIAVPGGRFELIGANGALIKEPEVVGELVYYGANVTLGYAECRQDLAKEDERNGRLATGDMAKMDKDGYYYIVGRKKRFLKIFGNRVNLDETERMIKRQFPDLDCACAGVDDLMSIYITSDGYAGEIEKYLMTTTGINRTGFKVKCVSEIPKNAAGKTLYSELG